jgi:N-acetylglucosamine kinase-like BadF-type ATPase
LDYILGLDGGATKTIAQVADLSGEVIAESESLTGNIAHGSMPAPLPVSFIDLTSIFSS